MFAVVSFRRSAPNLFVLPVFSQVIGTSGTYQGKSVVHPTIYNGWSITLPSDVFGIIVLADFADVLILMCHVITLAN